MAIGDITSVTIRDDGWSADVVVSQWTDVAGSYTYDFGSLGNTPANITSPKIVFTVVSLGYDSAGNATTKVRTVYGTKWVRKAHPNNAQKDETVGANLSVRIALSESIYAKDKIGGGNSGTAPTVTISAAWATSSVGPKTSNAVTNLTVVNNSTLAYPKCIAQWAFGHTPFYKRVENDFTLGAIAFHGHGIAAVKLLAVGNTSTYSTNAFVTGVTDHSLSATGLHYASYDMPVVLSNYTQAETITLNFIAYPKVGDAASILDTTGITGVQEDPRGLTQLTCVCDKTTAMRDYAVVVNRADDAVGSKSTVLATAETTTFANIGRALASGANLIYVKNGTHPILGREPTVAVKDYWVEVRPYPSHTPVIVRDISFRAYGTKKLAYIDFTSITSPGGNTYLAGGGGAQNRSLLFENCNFVNAAFADIGLGYDTAAIWFINSSLTGSEKLVTYGGSLCGLNLTGLNISNVHAELPIQSYGTVACKSVTNAYRVTFTDVSVNNPGPTPNNVIFYNNTFLCNAINGGDAIINRGAPTEDPLLDCAIIGNVLEANSVATSGPALWVAADSRTNTCNNVIVAHNTIVGQRANLFYNDSGTLPNITTNIFVRNNVFNGFAIKSDIFTHGVDGQNGARVGNWAQMNGVNWSDNRYTYNVGLWGFNQDYYGINTQYEDMSANIANEMGFTADYSTYGTGAGNGDYTPTLSSVLYNQPLYMIYQDYDLFGNPLK
jgi:hypothetical protein